MRSTSTVPGRQPIRRIRLALLAALAAACAPTATVTGRTPENPTREREYAGAVGPDRQALYEKRVAAEAAAGPKVETADAAQRVVGVASTRTYHRPDCAQLKDVPGGDRIQFTSPWDGLNGGYGPCGLCRPGP